MVIGEKKAEDVAMSEKVPG